jgi:hypothetical protein
VFDGSQPAPAPFNGSVVDFTRSPDIPSDTDVVVEAVTECVTRILQLDHVSLSELFLSSVMDGTRGLLPPSELLQAYGGCVSCLAPACGVAMSVVLVFRVSLCVRRGTGEFESAVRPTVQGLVCAFTGDIC